MNQREAAIFMLLASAASRLGYFWNTALRPNFLPRLHLQLGPTGDAQSAAEAAVNRWRVDIPGLELRASRFGLEFYVPVASRAAH